MELESNPLRVTALAAGGDGLGRLEDGRVVFIEGGVPGDLVELTDLRLGKRMARARIGRLIEKSSDRVEPRCRHFGVCGGCTWQHVDYAAQLEAKRAIVRDALERIGGIELPGEVEILGSPDPYAYRARARLREARAGIGYRARSSHEVVPVIECPVLVPAAFDRLQRLIAERRTRDDTSKADASRSSRARSRPVDWEILAGSNASTAHLVGAGTGKAAGSTLRIEVLGESLEASARSFVQGNALLWDTLAEEVRAQCLAPGARDPTDESGASEAAPRKFVELFAGIGFLTVPLVRSGLRGAVFESDTTALELLARNLEHGDLASSVEIHAGRVERRRDWNRRFEGVDLLLLDPPRVGLDASLRSAIAEFGPPRVVYVSCDPATLARDLSGLVAAGYRVECLRAIDLFPQTPHVEVVVRLERSGAPSHSANSA